MFENTTGELPMPEPMGMHLDPVTGPGFGIIVIYPDKQLCFVRWCCRNRCGGVYSKTLNRWTMITPITFEDFLKELKTNGVITTESCDSWEMRRWIKACKSVNC